MSRASGWVRCCFLWPPLATATSDDHFYIEAADGWLAHMPFVGTTHWHLRHPFVLAIAASFAAFGRTELALMLPTLLAYVSILLLTIWMVARSRTIRQRL